MFDMLKITYGEERLSRTTCLNVIKVKRGAQKVRKQKSGFKTILSAFFGHEYVPEKQIVKCNVYKEVIDWLTD